METSILTIGIFILISIIIQQKREISKFRKIAGKTSTIAKNYRAERQKNICLQLAIKDLGRN